MSSSPRLLMVLPQMPQDPASGAARSMRTICEMLAGAEWTVRVLRGEILKQVERENERARVSLASRAAEA